MCLCVSVCVCVWASVKTCVGGFARPTWSTGALPICRHNRWHTGRDRDTFPSSSAAALQSCCLLRKFLILSRGERKKERESQRERQRESGICQVRRRGASLT